MSDHFEFEIKRLVLVDSAGFCYVDLPVDEHAILLGNGNLGKSSLLNSLRLFLLPENNFKNSKNKFAFATPKRDGFYDNEESYNHYFPSKFSFLILEVSSNVGGSKTHCQILHRSSGHLAYERIFTPLPYAKIQQLFWDGNDDEDGIGYRVEGLSSSTVFKALKELDKNTISVKDPAKFKTLLYANDFLSPAAMRYSIFPLAECDEARIESLRTLILLLFDMNASSEPVANAVANIIEADKKFVDDVLDFNIEVFLGKHNDLKQQDIDLTKIENLTDKYQQLNGDFVQYRSLADSEKKFAAFYEQLTTVSEGQRLLLNDKSTELGVAQGNEREQGKLYKSLSDQNKKLTGEVSSLQRQQNKAQASVDKAQNLLVTYPDMPIAEVVEFIQSDISENNSRLAALESESQRAVRINKLRNQIEVNGAERTKRQAHLDNQHHSLEQQLPEGSWQVLAAVNKKLALANPTRELTAEEIATFENFTNLFYQDESSVAIYNERFEKQSSSMVRDDERMIQNLTSEINADNRELKQLEQGHSSAINKANDISNLKRDVQQAGVELVLIGDLDFHRKTVESLKQPLSEATTQLDANNQQITQEESKLHAFSAEHETLKAERAQLQTRVNALKDLQSSTQHMMTSQPRLAAAVKQGHADGEELELTAAVLKQINEDLIAVSELGNKLLFGLRHFVTEQVIEDERGIMAESPDRKAIVETFNLLIDTFNNLPGRRNVLQEQVRTHNESVAGYANILQKNHEHIKRFEQQLNRDFAEIEINDLDGIEVDIHIDKRFENLVQEVHKFDLLSDEMLPENFYERLKVFAEGFFKNGVTARLTMDKVVTNLSYRTRKKMQSTWQTKQQSNSTTALINLKLVQILLSKLRANGCSLMFPLVLDEVATVDVNQFDWLLDDIKRSGFNLFAASTHSASPELIYKIGRHHELGEMRTAKPYSSERTMVYWGGPEFFANEQTAQIEQLGLLEAVDEQTI
ncbi:MAG: hypothetical protein MJK04_13775 [Psychrosphaera sp.]|nr:hypothetical protein [Psychrosphaera sp.]